MKNKKNTLKENNNVIELIRKVGFKIKDAKRNNQPELVNKFKEQLKQQLASMKINWMQNPYAIEVLDESVKKNKVLTLGNYNQENNNDINNKINFIYESKKNNKMNKEKILVDRKIKMLTKKIEEVTGKKVTLKENLRNSNDLKEFLNKVQDLRNYFIGTITDKYDYNKKSASIIQNSLNTIQNEINNLSDTSGRSGRVLTRDVE